MPTMVFTYSPKPDVPFEEFKRFLAEVDQPLTLSVPSAKSSRILRVLSEGAPFACIELLEVTSFEDWERDTKAPELQEKIQKVLAQWSDYANKSGVIIAHGKRSVKRFRPTVRAFQSSNREAR